WPIRHDSREFGARTFAFEDIVVEVATSVGPPGVCALTIADLLARSHVDERAYGFKVRVPDFHDHLLLLCINIFKDKFDDAPAWCTTDLGRMVLSRYFDEREFFAVVRAGKNRCLVWLVADYLISALEGEARERWRSIRDRIGIRPPRRIYVATWK